jgi:protein TonB
MGKKKENIPDFDDLLFESRNKEYGAYQLRKKYNYVLIAGILTSSLIGCFAVIIPFMAEPKTDHILAGGGRFVQVEMEVLEPPKEEIYIPPAPPPSESTPFQEVAKYVPPEVVDTIIPVENTTISTDEFLAHSGDNQAEIQGNNGVGEDLLTGEVRTEEGEAFLLVEVMPSFKGGELNKFREWVNKRTNYPQDAINAKIHGTVFLTFVVEKDGSVSNVSVLKPVHPLIDSAAVKAISESPKWSPGLQRGEPVRVRFQIALNFIL